MKKRISSFIIALTATLALGLLSAGVGAQGNVSTNQTVLFALYDLDSTTDISCSFGILTPAGFIAGMENAASGLATTSGSSTTTTSVNTSGVFNNIAVGDVVWGQISGVRTGRVLTARASKDSATVDLAWTLPAAGVSLRYQKPLCGATNGWVAVDGLDDINIAFDIAQLNLTSGGIAFKIEGRFDPISTSAAVNLWPGNASADAHCGAGTYASGYCVYTAVANSAVSVTSAGVQHPMWIRLVTKLTGTDDGVDTTTLAEQIRATLVKVTR